MDRRRNARPAAQRAAPAGRFIAGGADGLGARERGAGLRGGVARGGDPRDASAVHDPSGSPRGIGDSERAERGNLEFRRDRGVRGDRRLLPASVRLLRNPHRRSARGGGRVGGRRAFHAETAARCRGGETFCCWEAIVRWWRWTRCC